jgi:ANTAR domain-containing protein
MSQLRSLAGSYPAGQSRDRGSHAAPEVPVVTESAPSDLDEGRLTDLPEIRAVIEQAKGILMATYGCGADEAGELLRRASRGGGVKAHVLAGQLVDLAARAGRS